MNRKAPAFLLHSGADPASYGIGTSDEARTNALKSQLCRSLSPGLDDLLAGYRSMMINKLIVASPHLHHSNIVPHSTPP
jgi:hypothetical protein